MPKEVDHAARRRELADAACRVIARNGLEATTLADVAEESGWSIGSIRHYFPNKDELIAAALWRVGERVDDRIRRRTAGGMTLKDLRAAAIELLPLDADGRQDSVVYLAFLAQAAVVPALADAAEGAAQRLQEPLVERIAYATAAGELPAHLDAGKPGGQHHPLQRRLAQQPPAELVACRPALTGPRRPAVACGSAGGRRPSAARKRRTRWDSR